MSPLSIKKNRLIYSFKIGYKNIPSFYLATLTPKVPQLCYHQKRSKTAISNISTKFLKKTFFDTCNHMIL